MFHFTIFAGSEARMPTRGFTSVTIFGGTELQLPTLAERVMQEERREEEATKSWFDRMRGDDANLVLTMFGATELRYPSLMAEYTALRSLITTATISREELAHRIRRLHAGDDRREVTTLTLFGAFFEGPVSRNKQLKALATAEKAGVIPSAHKRRLDQVVDAPPTSGMQVLGDLVAEMA